MFTDKPIDKTLTDNTFLFTMNLNHSFINETISNEKDPLWMILMDRSQLIMTIIGFLANIATSVTLIKNGQVRRKLLLSSFNVS